MIRLALTFLLLVGIPSVAIAQPSPTNLPLTSTSQTDKDIKESIWDKLLGPGVGALLGGSVSGLVSFYIFVVRSKREKQRDRISELLKQFLTEEFYLKARLVSQTYLIPGENKPKYELLKGKNFDQILELLEKSNSKEDQEAHFYIRAIPSFFSLVNELKEKNFISEEDKLFSKIYSWYWVNIIEVRQPQGTNSFLYQQFEWMATPDDFLEARKEKNRRDNNQQQGTSA